MILNALAVKLKRQARGDFRGRHFEATLIVQAVSWYLRYPLSYRDIEELFLERGLEVDHSTLNRWVLAYAPLIEKRLRQFRRPHCGSVRIDETYIRVRGQWRYLYRAIDKHGTSVDFLLTANRDLDAAKRFFRKMLKDQPLLAPDRIGTDGAGPYPPAIAAARVDGLLPQDPLHYVTNHPQQGIESDHSHGHVRGQGSVLGVHGSSPAVGSDPRSEPVSMTRWGAAPDQAHIRSPLVAAAPTSRIRRVGLRRPGPFYRSAGEASGHLGSATWIRQD